MTQRLKIGISACFLYPDPARAAFAKKTLQYVEQSVPHWVMSGGALPVMIPSPVGDVTGAKHFSGEGGVSLADYAQWLRDKYEIALVNAFVAADKPVFGICRGMQLINVAFGGTLVQDIPTQRPQALRHRDAAVYDQNFHNLDLVADTRLASLLGGGGHKINSVHHQCVKDLAPHFVVEARCPDDGTVEAIRHTGAAWVAGVQWHPEFHKLEYGTLDDAPILQDFLDAARASRAA